MQEQFLAQKMIHAVFCFDSTGINKIKHNTLSIKGMLLKKPLVKLRERSIKAFRRILIIKFADCTFSSSHQLVIKVGERRALKERTC